MSTASAPRPAHLAAYLVALGASGLTTVLAVPLRPILDLANIIMLFLLVVFLVALRLGRGPAAAAAVASVALFDYVFVPPHLGLIPTDAQYLVTLAVMLAVALVTAGLTAGVRDRERQTERLYQLARSLAGTRSRADVAAALAVYAREKGSVEDRQEVVDSLASIAVERLDAAAAAEEARLQAASDKLRASLLSALSHDLRTPLTALVGMADSLALGRVVPGAASLEAAGLIRDQARSMEHLLGNLLEMARLQDGRVVLRKEWQLMDDVISAGLRHLRLARNAHPVKVRVAPDLPLVLFDAVLMERVIWNLLENAVKHSPADAPVEIRAGAEGGQAWLAVCDRGPGFPPDRLEAVFELFVRGEAEAARPGVGLGLAICRAIVEAHGGGIRAENRADGGACVRLWLPLGTPPPFVEEEPEESGP